MKTLSPSRPSPRKVRGVLALGTSYFPIVGRLLGRRSLTPALTAAVFLTVLILSLVGPAHGYFVHIEGDRVWSVSSSGKQINELRAVLGLQENGAWTWDERNRPLGARIPVILIHQYNRTDTSYLSPTPEDWDNFAINFYKDDRDLKSLFKLYRMIWHSNDVSVYELGLQLKQFLETFDSDLNSGFNGKPLVIIGHSTGGLIARSYMQEHGGGARALRLITLATPHHGTPIANKPFRDDYIDDFDSQYFGNWSGWVDLIEGPQLSHDKPTRSDLHWDNYDSLFDYSHTPTVDYQQDKNDWLQRLNCVSPFNDKNQNTNCQSFQQGGSDYSAKIFAYGGSHHVLKSTLGSLANTWCYLRYPWTADPGGFFLCFGQSILTNVFGFGGDGAVPTYSAMYNANRSGKVQTRLLDGYDHFDMVLGKSRTWTDPLFGMIGTDLLGAWPGYPQPKIDMTSGGLAGTEISPLTVTVAKGATANVTFSSSRSSVSGGSITAYEWKLGNVVRTTASFNLSLAVGNYNVSLKITDSVGQSNVDSASIIVQEQSSPSVRPSVTTNVASQVTTTSAILNGQLTTNASSAAVWFQWGTTINYGQSTSAVTLFSDISTPIAWVLTGLLPNTSYHFRIVAQNAAGISYGQDRSFTTSAALDVSPPTVNITSPTSSPTFSTIFTAVALSGNASDDRGVTTVTWVNDRGGSGTAIGSTNWSISSIPLGQGQNIMTVTAWDAAGHSGSNVITVTSTPPDNVSPDTQILTGPSGTWLSSSFSFTWTGSDNVTATGNLQYTTHLEGYDWSSTPYSTGTSRLFSDIPNGTYTFWVRALDEAGNIDYTADTRMFTVNEPDLIAPTITSLFLNGGGANNDLFRTGREYPIFFETTDNIRPVTADIYYSLTGGAPWNSIATGISIQAGAKVFDWPIPSNALTTNGALRLVVRDEAGNSTERTFSPFTVLNGTPPSVQIIVPNGGEDWPLGSTQTITWTASASTPLNQVWIYSLRNNTVEFIANLPGSTTSYAWTLPTTGATNEALIHVVVEDINGNQNDDFSDDFFSISDPDAPPPAPWHVPQLVTTLPAPPHPSADQSIGDPAIAADQFGNLQLAAVYNETDWRDGVGVNYYTQQQVVYRKRTAGQWEPQSQITTYPVDVDNDGSDGFGPAHAISSLRVAVDSAGRPHIIWIRERLVQFPSFDDDLFYAHFDGSNWIGPINLSASVTTGGGSSTRFPAIAIDSLGQVHVVWTERIFPGTGWTTYHAIKTGGSWSQATPITLPDYTISEIVADGTGGLHLISSRDGQANQILHSTFNGSQWTTQSIVENWSDINDFSQLAIAPDGTLHAVWHRQTVLGGVPENYLDYSAFRSGVWTSPSALTLGQFYPPGLAIGVNALGGATVAWVDKSSVPPVGIFSIYASEPSVTGWAPITRISDRTTLVGSGTAISMAYDGSQAHIAWGGFGGVIWNWADYSTLFTVTPAQLSFGTVYVGQTGNQDLMLQNLTDSPISGTVQVTVPFAVVGGGQFTVGPGQSQNVTIVFTPTDGGGVSKSVSLSTSVGVFDRTVTGAGAIDTTPPETSITSGSTGTITINNATFNWTGTDNITTTPNLVYAYRLDPIEPNFSAFGAATSKTYNDLSNGNYTFYVKARDQAGNEDPSPATRSFTVGNAGPEITVTPPSLDFGSVAVGVNSAAQTVTVKNDGTADLKLGAIKFGGDNANQFNKPTDRCTNKTLVPGASCTVSVRFKPTTVGPKTATLIIPSNDTDENPVNVSLSGDTATLVPDITVTLPSIGFGSIEVGVNSAAQTVSIKSDGTAALKIGAIKFAGTNANQFNKPSDRCSKKTLAPGASCTVSVRFKPTSSGPKTATLIIPSNDPDENPVNVDLSGTGTP
jgi:hypothetical protein